MADLNNPVPDLTNPVPSDPTNSPAPESAPVPTPVPPPATLPPVGPGAEAAGTPQGYISNPLALFKPSMQAVRLNLWDLLIPVLIFIGAVILLVVTLFGSLAVNPAAAVNIGLFTGSIFLIIGLVIAVVVLAPYTNLVLLASAKGEKLKFREAISRTPHYSLKFLAAGFLALLAILGGLILLVIPGLIFAAWFSLAPWIIVNEDIGAVEALKKSKALVKGHVIEMWGMLGFGSAVGILNIVPIVGPIITIAAGFIYSAAPAIRYLQLEQLQGTDERTKIHWANYLVILLALVGGTINNHAKTTAPTTPAVTPTGTIQTQ